MNIGGTETIKRFFFAVLIVVVFWNTASKAQEAELLDDGSAGFISFYSVNSWLAYAGQSRWADLVDDVKVEGAVCTRPGWRPEPCIYREPDQWQTPGNWLTWMHLPPGGGWIYPDQPVHGFMIAAAPWENELPNFKIVARTVNVLKLVVDTFVVECGGKGSLQAGLYCGFHTNAQIVSIRIERTNGSVHSPFLLAGVMFAYRALTELRTVCTGASGSAAVLITQPDAGWRMYETTPTDPCVHHLPLRPGEPVRALILWEY